MIKTLFLSGMLFCAAASLEAQTLPAASDSLAGSSDSLARTNAAGAAIDGAMTVSGTNTFQAPVRWHKDSLQLMEYHHVAEILAHHPAVFLHELGNFGQPVAIRGYGASPNQQTLSINGLDFDDLITGATESYLASSEDIASIRLFPQYQAFWYGNPGDAFAADIEEKEWDAPRPITRLRHTEAPYEYLYTDAMFTLNPSDESNVYIAATRTVIGSTNSNNSARFANNLSESWNIRLRYRRDLNELLQLRTAVRYNDHFTLLNGGTAGTFDFGSAAPLTFENESIGNFAAIAFDPKAATLVNETMQTVRQRYSANADLLMKWTRDSSQVTHVQLAAVSDVRRFRDDLQQLYVDPIFAGSMNLTDEWSLLQAQLSHTTALSWATLSLRGSVGSYAAQKGGAAMNESGLLASARGRLDLLLGPAALSGFAALDHRYDQSTISLGAGAEVPLGSLRLWGGLSYSPRIRSLMETAYLPEFIIIAGNRTPDLDKISILEAGLRWVSPALEANISGFLRYEDRYQYLQTSAYRDTLRGRYMLTVHEVPDGESLTYFGGNAAVRATLWRFHLDQQFNWTRLDSQHPVLGIATIPEYQYSASLYYRGSLIEGTLDLKVGGRFVYWTDYLPLTYHPEAALFTLPADLDNALTSYTDLMRLDLYLFATIKERATLHVSMHNVFDSDYITAGFYPMYNRSLRFGVDWLFFD